MSSDDKTVKLPQEGDELTPAELTRFVRLVYNELKSLNEKVDARLHDTRPIWEAVQSQLSQLSESIEDVNSKIEILHGDVLKVRTDYKKTNRRIDDLEKQPA